MKNNRHHKPRRRYILLLTVFAALFCLSAYKVTSQLLTERKETRAFDDLIRQVSANRQARQSAAASRPAAQDDSPAPAAEDTPPAADTAAAPTGGASPAAVDTPPAADTAAAPTGDASPAAEDTPSAADTAAAPTAVPPVLDIYEPLYQENPDLYGWIIIEGTQVNYPVMHTPRDSEYYLHRAFDRSYSFSGVPFLEGTCYNGCGNYLIYGHHMKNGTMFADIVQYASEAYWREHPLIYFDTLYETGTYEVIAAFYSKLFKASDTDGFRYYLYTDLSDPDVFNEYIGQVQWAAEYDTGLTAAYGDQLLTLSTCEYSVRDNRFVVVARRID